MDRRLRQYLHPRYCPMFSYCRIDLMVISQEYNHSWEDSNVHVPVSNNAQLISKGYDFAKVPWYPQSLAFTSGRSTTLELMGTGTGILRCRVTTRPAPSPKRCLPGRPFEQDQDKVQEHLTSEVGAIERLHPRWRKYHGRPEDKYDTGPAEDA